uniref:hypothetical protein n=1 Tax=Nocardia suismassiliense TaxID=2077092 RepID=UPI003F4926EC
MTQPPSVPDPDALELVAATKPEFAALMRRAALRAGLSAGEIHAAEPTLSLGTCYRYLREDTIAFPWRSQVQPWFRACGCTEAQIGTVLKLWHNLNTKCRAAEDAARTGTVEQIDGSTPADDSRQPEPTQPASSPPASHSVYRPPPRSSRRKYIRGVVNAVVLLAGSVALSFLPAAATYPPYQSDLFRLELVILRVAAVLAPLLAAAAWWLARRRNWPIRNLTSWPTVIVLGYSVVCVITVWSMVAAKTSNRPYLLNGSSTGHVLPAAVGANAGLLFGLLAMIIVTIGLRLINIRAVWEMALKYPLVPAAPALAGLAWTAVLSIGFFYTVSVAVMAGILVAAAVLLVLERLCARALLPPTDTIERAPVGTDRLTDIVPAVTTVKKIGARRGIVSMRKPVRATAWPSPEDDSVEAFCADLQSLRLNRDEYLSFRDMAERSVDWDTSYGKTALGGAVKPANGLPTARLVQVFVGIVTEDSDEIRRWARRRDALADKIQLTTKSDGNDVVA